MASTLDATPPDSRWLVLARGVLTCLLAVAAVAAGIRGIIPSPWPLLAVAGAMGGYHGLFLVVRRRRGWSSWAPSMSLTLDIVALTVFLHYSGDIENPLMFAYVLPVVTGAVLLRKRTGYWLAGLASLLFVAMVAFTLLDRSPVRLEHHHLALLHDYAIHERIDPDLTNQGSDFIVAHLAILVMVLFGAAFGFGTLEEENRRKEVRLESQNERMALLLRLLPEGVMLFSRDGRLLMSNPAAQELLGGWQGPSLQALPEELELERRAAEAGSQQAQFEGEFRGRVIGHALARGDPDGHLIWVFRDLTESRRLMAELLHQSKMADLGLLAAGIAHEIGNPLSSMSAIVQVLEMKRSAPELRDRFEALHANLDRVNRIVQDINGFAKPSEGTRSRVPLRKLVEGAASILRFHEKAKAVKLEIEPEGLDAEVEGVEDQLVQVLLNLLLNAADASGGRGTIRVRAGRSGRDAILSVIDHGVGISKEARQRLFTPFFTTKSQGNGTGLGLFVSESIVRAHGGRIEITSQPGQGSTFSVALPLATLSATASPSDPRAAPGLPLPGRS